MAKIAYIHIGAWLVITIPSQCTIGASLHMKTQTLLTTCLQNSATLFWPASFNALKGSCGVHIQIHIQIGEFMVSCRLSCGTAFVAKQ